MSPSFVTTKLYTLIEPDSAVTVILIVLLSVISIVPVPSTSAELSSGVADTLILFTAAGIVKLYLSVSLLNSGDIVYPSTLSELK